MTDLQAPAMPDTARGIQDALDNVMQVIQQAHGDFLVLMYLAMLDAPRITLVLMSGLSAVALGFAEVRPHPVSKFSGRYGTVCWILLP